MIVTRPLYVLGCDRCEGEITPGPAVESSQALQKWAAEHDWLIHGDFAWHRACATQEADPDQTLDADMQPFVAAALGKEDPR